MTSSEKSRLRTIINREMLMTLKRCPVCNHPFNLGDPVVLACGDWQGPPLLIHENEAVFDARHSAYVERACYEAGHKPCILQ